MKKGMIFVLGSLVCTPALFADCEIETAAESARIIRYTVTIHREETYNAEQWNNLTQDVVRAVKRNMDDSRDMKEGMQAIFKGIKGVYRSAQDDELGIHGSITIAFGDGECPKDRCGEVCNCKDKYRGVCPCGLDNQRSCKELEKDDGGCCCKSIDCSKEKCDAACRADCAGQEKGE